MKGLIYRLLARIRALFSGNALDRELNEELESHIAMMTDDNIRRGMDPESARRDALVRIGSRDSARELHREARGIPWLESSMQDLRLAVRLALKSPWLSAIAILSLAIGIGANLTAFNIARAILWQPLPVSDANLLMTIYTRAQNGAGAFGELSYPEYEYFRDHNDVLDGLATYVRIYFFERANSDSQRIAGEIVSSNFFSVLGLRTILGRSFEPGNDRKPAVTSEVVISYGFWQTQFAGAADVLGKTIWLGSADSTGSERGERPYTVIGVADRDFRGILLDWLEPPQFWVPINAYPATALSLSNFQAWNWHALPTAGRLKPNVTMEQATAELKALDRRMTQDHPERAQAFSGKYDFSIDVLPLQKARFWPAYRDEIVTYVVLVIVVVTIVLGIACLNLANLMIARSTARRRELAVRRALGAGRGRLIRQVLAESLLLSCVGGIGGLLLASGTWRILAATGSAGGHFGRPFRVALPPDLQIDPQLALFVIGISIFTGVLFGVWPAWKASRVDVNTTLKEGSQKGPLAGLRTRSALISVQIAASVVLLVSASLFVQTVRNADAVGRLVDRSHIGLVAVNVRKEQYTPLLERIRAIPGVEHACLSAGPGRTSIRFMPEGTKEPVDTRVQAAAICPDYFAMFGIQILKGTNFAVAESELYRPVVINEKLAKQLTSSGDALGQHFAIISSGLYRTVDPINGTTFEVIGIVKDTNTGNYREGVQPAIYVSSAQYPASGQTTLDVQTKGLPYSVFPMIHQALRDFDPEAPLVNARTLQDDVDAQLSRERLSAAVAGVLATIAFALTLIGLYGVVSYSVMSRIREIGIRMAIGAQTGDVLRMLAAQNMVMVLIGLGAGVVVSVAATRMIAAMLYGVEASQTSSFAGVALVIIAFALAATLLPSWRASRMSPSRTLRHE